MTLIRSRDSMAIYFTTVWWCRVRVAMFLDNLRTSICGRRGVCKAASMANNCFSACWPRQKLSFLSLIGLRAGDAAVCLSQPVTCTAFWLSSNIHSGSRLLLFTSGCSYLTYPMRLFVRDEVLRTIPLPYAPFHALSIVVEISGLPAKWMREMKQLVHQLGCWHSFSASRSCILLAFSSAEVLEKAMEWDWVTTFNRDVSQLN